MTPKNLISLCMLSCFVIVLSGFKSEKNLKTQRNETSPSLLSFVDMNRYTLVLSDPTTRDQQFQLTRLKTSARETHVAGQGELTSDTRGAAPN